MLFFDIETAAGTGLSPWAASATLAAALLLTPPAAMASEPAPGLRVVKDPVTGQLRAPTSDEASALESAAKARGPARAARRGMLTGRMNPAEIRHPDGTVEQELDESSMSYSVATRGPNGSVNTYCVTGPDAAASILKGRTKGMVKDAKEHSRDDK